MAYASITVGTTTQIVGRAFAQAAVTFAGGDSITLPSAASTANNAHLTNTPSSSSSGLSTAAEVCAVVFSVVGFFLIIGGAYFLLKRKADSLRDSTVAKEKLSSMAGDTVTNNIQIV
jgi:hypothetical protein